MYKQQYEDFKYIMQDTYQLYLGAKYTFQEIMDNEDIPFKFRLIVERYIYSEIDADTTLESQFYYLTEKELLYKIFKQMKTKVKINIIEEKKSLFGGSKKQYATQMIPVTELVKMTPEQKEQQGVVIQEIIVGKLALMSF